jgi:hypothetical protein
MYHCEPGTAFDHFDEKTRPLRRNWPDVGGTVGGTEAELTPVNIAKNYLLTLPYYFHRKRHDICLTQVFSITEPTSPRRVWLGSKS